MTPFWINNSIIKNFLMLMDCSIDIRENIFEIIL